MCRKRAFTLCFKEESQVECIKWENGRGEKLKKLIKRKKKSKRGNIIIFLFYPLTFLLETVEVSYENSYNIVNNRELSESIRFVALTCPVSYRFPRPLHLIHKLGCYPIPNRVLGGLEEKHRQDTVHDPTWSHSSGRASCSFLYCGHKSVFLF